MLAREIIEDSLLSFLTREDPNVELADDAVPHKVILSVTHCILIFYFLYLKIQFLMNLLM